MKQPTVALVYDRVTTHFGGAELVLQALHELYPAAKLYTSLYDPDIAHWASEFSIVTSWLQKLPRWLRRHRWLAPLMPLAFESFTFPETDIIISITSAEAKGIITKPGQLHLCYLLTPTRYLYSHQQSYLQSLPILRLTGIKFLAAAAANYLRWWDQVAAYRPDTIIGISNLVAKRCQHYYQRSVETVIYPPVGQPMKPATQPPQPHPYGVVISRLVDYKRVDLAISACISQQHHLYILGTGPALTQLRQQAKKSPFITFLGQVDDQTKYNYLAHARWLMMPGLEDFGIAALEAQSLGVPVILHQNSGVAELLHSNQDSIFIGAETEQALVTALKKTKLLKVDHKLIAKNMKKYDKTIFQRSFAAQVTAAWQHYQSNNDEEGENHVRQ